jgi:hypothetical protein
LRTSPREINGGTKREISASVPVWNAPGDYNSILLLVDGRNATWEEEESQKASLKSQTAKEKPVFPVAC